MAEGTNEVRAALEDLANPKRWDHSDTGRVTWLHTDGVTKPWELAQTALDALAPQDPHPALCDHCRAYLPAGSASPQQEAGEATGRPEHLKLAEYAPRLDRLNNILLEECAREFGLDIDRYRNEAGELSAGGLINARRVIGRLLREACKGGAVNVDTEQAYWLANAGSAGHDDTAADLLRASPPQPQPLQGDHWITETERARVLLEDGEFGKAHEVLEHLRQGREVAQAEAADAAEDGKQ